MAPAGADAGKLRRYPLPSDFVEIGQIGRVSLAVARGTPVLCLPGERGWIIGQLFRKNGEAVTINSLSPHEAEAMLASRARTLIADYWGSYLAILCPREGGQSFLVRDPSGFMPCYMHHAGDSVYAVSDVAVMVDAGLFVPSVDWAMVHAHLLTQELRYRKTCLSGLSELAQGHALPFDDTDHQRMLWNPVDHVHTDPGDASDIAARLEAVILSTTAAMAQGQGSILVGASGGLDSSIVCAALAAARHPFTCFTMATHDPSGDERRYVRELASGLKVDCLEYVYETELIDVTRSAAQHLPRPVGRFFMQQIESCYRAAWSQTGAEAIFTGNGGDNVFSYLRSAAPVVDRLLAQGLGTSTWQTMIDMCRVTGCDIATMLRGVLRGLKRRRSPAAWPTDFSFLAKTYRSAEAPSVLTPWLDGAAGLLPGKRAHIAALMHIQHAIEGYERKSSIPVMPVLLSQPVIELCLSIPSWRWCEGGINRAMARLAFANRLPPGVIRRTSKASPESLSADLFESSLPLLREQLLGGLLSEHGVIDRQAVEQALVRTATRRGQVFHRLLALAEAEAWSRHWQGSRAV